jgi:endothelin-converting enzyme
VTLIKGEDFNQFSCGSFIKNRRIADDASTADTFGDLRNNLAAAVSGVLSEPVGANDTNSTENAKIYYKACMNETRLEETGVQELLKVIDELGGWLLIKPNPPIEITKESIFKKIVQLRKLDLNPLFTAYVSTNPKTPDVYILRVS